MAIHQLAIALSFEVVENFITDDTGQYILFNNANRKHYGQLYLYSSSLLSAINTITIYDSIETMIESTIEAYQAGVFSWSADEGFSSNVRAYWAIAKKYNPNSAYYQQR